MQQAEARTDAQHPAHSAPPPPTEAANAALAIEREKVRQLQLTNDRLSAEATAHLRAAQQHQRDRPEP
eukprot:5314384-Pleurochrysis_carterae.AAC.1